MNSKHTLNCMKNALLSVAAVAGMASGAASAASSADIDRLTTYAVVLGRAVGCQIDATNAYSRVGRWMDRAFPPGSEDQKTYLPVFIVGVKHNAEQQAAGRSPDSCSSVRRTLDGFPWP